MYIGHQIVLFLVTRIFIFNEVLKLQIIIQYEALPYLY